MTLESLPTELLIEILHHLPVLDYYNLKFAGSRYVTEVIRQVCALIPRSKYLSDIAFEDARRRGPDMPRRRSMEIMVARGQSSLVAHYQKKYRAIAQRRLQDAKSTGAADSNIDKKVMSFDKRRPFRRAIHWAAFYGSKNIVEMLLEYIHLEAGKHEGTALHYAAIGGQAGIVDFLLQHGAYVNALDGRGKTPLGVSVEEGQSIVAAQLRAHGGKMDVHEVLDGDEEWVKVYLDQQSSHGDFRAATRYIPGKLYDRFYVLCLYEGYRREKSAPGPKQLTVTTGQLKRIAIESGFASIFISLLDNAAEIDAPINGCSGTALYTAVRRGHHAMIRTLLQHGADPNTVARRETLTPWQIAIDNGDVTAVGIFLDQGVPVDIKGPDGKTALHRIAQDSNHGTNLMLKFLLHRQGSIHSVDDDGNTPLHSAAGKNRLYEIEALIRAGAEVDARNNAGRTPLAEAARFHAQNHSDIEPSHHVALVFLRAGAGIHREDNESLTAFHHALRCSRYSAGRVNIFIEHGADINTRDKAGRTALHHALANHDADYETVLLLLKQGADVNAAANNGDLPIHLAVRWEAAIREIQRNDYCEFGNVYQNGYPSGLLLERGADPNARDAAGLAPLHLADDIITLKNLLLHGARVDERDPHGRTTLLRLLAITPYKDSYSNISYHAGVLLAHGADPNAKDNMGYTPFMYAVGVPGRGSPLPHDDLMTLLMHFGADPFLENPAGISAHHLCQDSEVKKLLSEDYRQRPVLDTESFGWKEIS